MKIYISGPITGTDDYTERFAKAERMLTDKGYSAVNPAYIKLPKDASWHDYMAVSLAMLIISDGVYLLSGWNQSKGASIEYAVASAAGKEILFEK